MSESDADISAERAGWTFDGIAERFENHIEKSIPHYRDGHELICQYSDFFLRNDSLVHDIGCATGALSRRLLEWNHARHAMRYIGLDPVTSMIEHAREQTTDSRATFLEDNIVTYEPAPTTVFISYYTLQFIHPAFRQDVLRTVYNALEWGGALFLFEKVRGADARFQDYASQVYTGFKRSQGFDAESILNKGDSLKGVLEPFSTQGNLDLMKRAGFVDITTIWKWVCFEGWLAIK